MEHPASRFDFPVYPFTATRFEAPVIELGAGATATFQVGAGADRAQSMVWKQNGVDFTYLRQPDPNRLDCLVRGAVAILSMVGTDEGEYLVESSSDLVEWKPAGSLSGPGKTLEVELSAAPSARFFRSSKSLPARPASWLQESGGPTIQWKPTLGPIIHRVWN